MLATVVWDGGGSDANWSTPENWAGDVAPLPGAILHFPELAAGFRPVNDFPAGTSFGGVLLESPYAVSGNAIRLDGVLESGGRSLVDLPIIVGQNTSIESSDHLVLRGEIDLAGNDLNLVTAMGAISIVGSIFGNGNLVADGNGSVRLSGNNAYTGITYVGNNELSVLHPNGLGVGDGTPESGVVFTKAGATVGVTSLVDELNEHMSSVDGVDIQLFRLIDYTSGTDPHSIWKGDIVSGAGIAISQNISPKGTLVIEGNTLAKTGSDDVLISGSKVIVEGDVLGRLLIGGDVELNGNASSLHAPSLLFTNSSLAGIGEITWFTQTGEDGVALLYGTVAPGKSGIPGVFTIGSVEFGSPSSGLEIDIRSNVPGTGYDQLHVNGSVHLDGDLNLNLDDVPELGEIFTIIVNDGADPIEGQFDRIPEGGFVESNGTVFRVSYQGGTDQNDVTLTVTEIEHLPVGDYQLLRIPRETRAEIVLTGSDEGNGPLTFSIERFPTRGTLTGDGANWTYQPHAGITGPDHFDFRITNEQGGFTIESVWIWMLGENLPLTLWTESASGSVTESQESETLTESGLIRFADRNEVDFFTIESQFVSSSSNSQLGTLQTDFVDGYIGPGGERRVEWEYQLDNDLVRFLAFGESITETFDVTITDGADHSVNVPVEITIVGAVNELIVTTTSDTEDPLDGETSLREAISQSNAMPEEAGVEIRFDWDSATPGFANTFVISPTSQLPVITHPVSILGSGRGSSAETVIDGSLVAVAGADGIRVSSGGVRLTDLTIQNFSGDGVEFFGSDGGEIHGSRIKENGASGVRIVRSGGIRVSSNTIILNSRDGVQLVGDSGFGNVIESNQIGVDSSDASDGSAGNGRHGIVVGTPGNLIENNTISGNSASGIVIGGANAGDNQVFGNRIGLDSHGQQAVPNAMDGIIVKSPNNQIGGTLDGLGNVISGNTRNGVVLTGPNAIFNQVRGNVIGLDSLATSAVGNGELGVVQKLGSGGNDVSENTIAGNGGTQLAVLDSLPNDPLPEGNSFRNNLIGMTTSGDEYIRINSSRYAVVVQTNNVNLMENRISGSEFGIVLGGEQSHDNTVQGNWIGTDGQFDSAEFGMIAGVTITQGAYSNLVFRNEIANSTADGVRSFSGGNNNEISQNTFVNNQFDIDLADNHANANDPSDADEGPNRMLNSPKIISTSRASSESGTRLEIEFSIDSAVENASYPIRVEFYVLHEDSRTTSFLDATLISQPGMQTTTLLIGEDALRADEIVAIAIDADGNTSEFGMRSPIDVDGNGVATALDALLVLNHIHRNSAVEAERPENAKPASVGRLENPFDVNRDGVVTASDALMVINRLNLEKHALEGSRTLDLVYAGWIETTDLEFESGDLEQDNFAGLF